MEEKIRSYILENFMFTDDASKLGPNDSLLERGIVDSTGIMEIINFIETEFGIQVADEEMIPENLGSVTAIVGYLKQKKAA